MAEPTGLVRLLSRVLRSRTPQELLRALTDGGQNAGLPPDGIALYLDGKDQDPVRFPAAPPGGDPLLPAVRRVLRTGRATTLGPLAPGTRILPLGPAGRVRGALAVPPAAGRTADAEELALIAECCGRALPDPAETGPGLADAVRAARAGVFAWDFVSDNAYWDERTRAIFGLDPASFGGSAETFFSTLHPDDVPALQAAIAQVAEDAATAAAHGDPDGAGRYQVGFRVRHPDGSVHHVTEYGRVLMDEAGHPTRTLGLLLETDPGIQVAPRGPESPDSSRDSFLFTLTRALSQAVTVRDVTEVMTRLARPALGAENLILGLTEAGEMRIVGDSSVSTSLQYLRPAAHAAMSSAATREQPLFIEDLSRPPGPALAGLPTGGLPARSWVVLALGSVDRVTGACLISFARPRHFDAGERTFYTAVAVILTQSLERARLFDTEHQLASDLQQAMLPGRLPPLPSLTVHSRYLPGTRGMQIGGDWYDLLPRRDGTAALIIGDVQGHDAYASAVMGQLRVALRASAEARLDPGAVLAHVNRVHCDLDTDRFATCTYLVLDPVDGTLRGARAGHPHPWRVRGGAVSEVELAGGPPLGVDPWAGFPTTTARLADDEALLLFTDGLVERRDADIDVCVREMIDEIHRWGAPRGPLLDLGDLVDFLAGQEAPGRIDDIALLAVRRRPRA
ncbi:SpoIIE family protein phosphatase [Streptomyces sp. NPDC058045]|uniref:SpoIIE family protein phosphatase n=1 Tax=Streptomyces sp. NPDC058045 TaxID=3346311 RepID=UPI0036EF7EFB